MRQSFAEAGRWALSAWGNWLKLRADGNSHRACPNIGSLGSNRLDSPQTALSCSPRPVLGSHMGCIALRSSPGNRWKVSLIFLSSSKVNYSEFPDSLVMSPVEGEELDEHLSMRDLKIWIVALSSL